MLYLEELARVVEPELFKSGGAKYFVAEGIAKLESMLMPSSYYFAFWPGEAYLHYWSSVYAAHFLVEARKAGYQVSDRVYDAMLLGLKNLVKRSMQNQYELEQIAYACYVLAAAGHPEKSTMLYLKNSRLGELSDYNQFQLAGAFAFSGDLKTAFELLPETIAPRNGEKRESGANFNSSVRAQAIMLELLAEVNENHPAIPSLVKHLSDAASQNNRWYTTQENAFAFLALGKILKKQIRGQYTGTFTLNGRYSADFDSKEQRYAGKNWGGSEVNLSVKGTGTCYYHWTAFGIPAGSSIEEFDKELQVRRRYLSKDGKPIENNIFKHGDLLVAEVTVKALTEDLENVVVVDMLPAGFEIENPRLATSAGLPLIFKGEESTEEKYEEDRSKGEGFKPDYMDIRDDRLIFFGKFPRQQEKTFYYALRAVTPGEFVLPPVAAEAMYDPTKSSVASSGRIRVVE